MPSILSQFFSKDHWKNPFTIQIPQATAHIPEASDGTAQKVKIGLGKRVTAIFLAVASGVFSLGFLAVPVFFLSASAFKNWELRQRKFTNETGKPGTDRVPNPNQKKSEPSSEGKSKSSKKLPKINTSKAISLGKAGNGPFPPLPEEGITMGLDNQTRTTCWLNSALKYLAGTTSFDPIYHIEVTDELLRIETNKNTVAQFQQELQNFLQTLQEKETIDEKNREIVRHFKQKWNKIFKNSNIHQLSESGSKQAASQLKLQQLLNRFAEKDPVKNAQGKTEYYVDKTLIEADKNALKEVLDIWPKAFHSSLIDYAIKKNEESKQTIVNFQKSLKDFIFTLRTQTQGHIKASDCTAFGKLVSAIMKDDLDANVGRNQMDSSEFFTSLQRTFNFPPSDQLHADNQTETNKKNYTQLVTLYQPKENTPNAKMPHRSEFTGTIKIPITYEEAKEKGPITFQNYINEWDIVTVKADFGITEAPQDDLTGGTTFETRKYPINLPETIQIYFPRVIGVVENGAQKISKNGQPEVMKCKRHFDIDSNGCISLMEYNFEKTGQISSNDVKTKTQIIENKDTEATIEVKQESSLIEEKIPSQKKVGEPWLILPKRECTYEITQAILHSGSERSGHYVTIQKAGDHYLYHSDEHVAFMSPEKALEKIREDAIFLQFQLVESILASGDISHAQDAKKDMIEKE